MTTIAMTGATGFVGQTLLEAALARGHRVRALTRRTPPQGHASAIEWIKGDMANPGALAELCAGADQLVHVAGLVKARSRAEFFDVNDRASAELARIAVERGVKKLLLISSLAAREPQLSHYGASKRAGEISFMKAVGDQAAWSILRPPAVYGPREREIYKVLRYLRRFPLRPVFPALGGLEGRASFIHVADLANAILEMLDGQEQGRITELDDGRPGGYAIQDVARAMGGDRSPLLLPLPFWLISPVGVVSDLWTGLSGRASMTSLSHLRYLCHKDWAVDASLRPDIANWQPQYDLFSGMKQTQAWYESHNAL